MVMVAQFRMYPLGVSGHSFLSVFRDLLPTDCVEQHRRGPTGIQITCPSFLFTESSTVPNAVRWQLKA